MTLKRITNNPYPAEREEFGGYVDIKAGRKAYEEGKAAQLEADKVQNEKDKKAREGALGDYTNGKISFERLAEEVDINFYTLRSAFMHFTNTENIGGNKMKAIVIEIQIGGGKIVHTLEEACREYIKMLASDEPARTKIHFFIKLPNDGHKSITIRDEDGETVAYGDFDGLPSFLDYAKEVTK